MAWQYIIPALYNIGSTLWANQRKRNQRDPTEKLRALASKEALRLRGKATNDVETGLISNATSATRSMQNRALAGLFSRNVNPSAVSSQLQETLAPSEANLAETKNRILQFGMNRRDKLQDQASNLELQAEGIGAEWQAQRDADIEDTIAGGVEGVGYPLAQYASTLGKMEATQPVQPMQFRTPGTNTQPMPNGEQMIEDMSDDPDFDNWLDAQTQNDPMFRTWYQRKYRGAR